jgi:hypothetical protein
MRFRNTLITLLVFALLGGYVYLFEIRGKGSASEATAVPSDMALWQMQPADVVQLEVTGPDGRTRLTREGDASWSLVDVTTEARQPANDARIGQIVDSLANLRATRVFTGTPDLAEYGLMAPAWQATLRLRDGSEQTLQWGDQTPDRSSYYVKPGKEGTVYVIAAFTIEDMQRLVHEPAYAPTSTPTAPPTTTTTLTTTMPTATVPTATVAPAAAATPSVVTATPPAQEEGRAAVSSFDATEGDEENC